MRRPSRLPDSRSDCQIRMTRSHSLGANLISSSPGVLMSPQRLAMIWFGLLLFSASLDAQTKAFTQVGTWSCQTGCQTVTFPTPFGGVPAVIMTGCASFHLGGTSANALVRQCFSAAAQNPTAQGFTPTRGVLGTDLRGTWVAVGPLPPLTAAVTAMPKYLVLTVIYAPPGTNGGRSSSSVSYQAGSTTGVTTSSSQTFQVGTTVSTSLTTGLLGGSGTSFSYSNSATDNQSFEVKKSTTTTITQAGPAQDGINHDEDEIWLLLTPKILLSLSSSPSASWSFANTNAPIQYVHVGWLNGHTAMPSGVASTLGSAGITSQDYADIISYDPLADGLTNPMSPRFTSANTTFPYEPPLQQGDAVPTVSLNISNSSTTTTGASTEKSYGVGLTIATGGQGPVADLISMNLKDETKWTWTNKASQSTANATSQSATLTIGGPSFGYSGPSLIYVYYDNIYGTFAFAPPFDPIQQKPVDLSQALVRGHIVGPSGASTPRTEVVLVEHGIEHRTLTNAKGEFAFFGSIQGPVTLRARNANPIVVSAFPALKVVLRATQ